MLQEARVMKGLAEKIAAERNNAEELMVAKQIEAATKNGAYNVTITGEISAYLKDKLEQYGYNVGYNSSSYQREPATTTISWV